MVYSYQKGRDRVRVAKKGKGRDGDLSLWPLQCVREASDLSECVRPVRVRFPDTSDFFRYTQNETACNRKSRTCPEIALGQVGRTRTGRTLPGRTVKVK
eukprot:1052172-Prymnesium_polylepis.1